MGKNLRDRVKEFENSLPLMEGREKGECKHLIGQAVTISDFGFMTEGSDKEYVAFIIKEDDKRFYFGGQVLTDQLKQLHDEGFYGEVVKDGLPVLFGEKTSKTKNAQGRYNTYTTVTFYPSEV